MLPSPDSSRRRFIKTVAVGAAYSTLLDRSWNSLFAGEVRVQAASTTGTLRLRLPQWPALLQESGSVRLVINPLRGSPPTGPTPNGSFYPVIINRGPSNKFFALNSRCTHQGCAVSALDPSTNRCTCPCHGSVFAIDGRRISGLASTNLATFTATFDGGEILEVKIPSLGYSLTGSVVEGATTGGPRVRLAFRALRNIDYEVRFHRALGEPPVVVPFSTTLDGALDREVLTVTSDSNVNLFVSREFSSGFYVVAVKVSEA